MQLDRCELGQRLVVRGVAWDQLPAGEGTRLRALGVEEGAELIPLHRGMLFWADPLAVRVGRMTIAMRHAHAAAIDCDAIS